MRVWRLEPLTDEEVGDRRPARARPTRSAAWPARSGRTAASRSTDDAFEHLVSLAGGDARAALNVLEGAAALAEGEDVRDADGHVSPRLEDVEAAAQQRVLAYDRAGDGHYDTVSAFIKSLRGNDPDAALYWLAAMIAAGEDPRFIARRLIISASEDVGNADPRALQVAVAAGQALDWIGLPEAQYALAQATTYIATAPKSNRSGAAYWAAVARRRGAAARCRSRSTCATRPTARMKQHGIGVGYRYPHDFEGADVDQQYLPDELADRRYYLPDRPGLRVDDRRPDGRPRRGPRRGQGRRQDPARCRPRRPRSRHHAGDGPHEDARDEPQEARRDREAGRRRARCSRRASRMTV